MYLYNISKVVTRALKAMWLDICENVCILMRLGLSYACNGSFRSVKTIFSENSWKGEDFGKVWFHGFVYYTGNQSFGSQASLIATKIAIDVTNMRCCSTHQCFRCVSFKINANNSCLLTFSSACYYFCKPFYQSKHKMLKSSRIDRMTGGSIW